MSGGGSIRLKKPNSLGHTFRKVLAERLHKEGKVLWSNDYVARKGDFGIQQIDKLA